MGAGKADVVRAVRSLGQRGTQFQFPQLREKLGIQADDKNGASQVHNLLKRLIAVGAVDIAAPGARERNRYYWIKDEEKLRSFAPAPAPPAAENGAPRASGAADRLGRIEDRLTRLEGVVQSFGEKLDHMDGRLSELAAVWA